MSNRNKMKDDYNLSKWLNEEMSESELAEFKQSPDYETYQKIKSYSSEIKTTDFDGDKILNKVLKSKNEKSKTISLLTKWSYRVAAILLFVIGLTIYYQNVISVKEFAENGKKSIFLLPDNSQITLNSGSEIRYKNFNWYKNRKLNLNGEAYFKVSKGHTFEVQTSLGKVTVLGTQFNVRTRKNRFEVVCYEGRVKVNYINKQVLLTAGHSISIENNVAIDSAKVVVSKPEWTSNELSFTKETLQNITEELERQYNTSIKIKDIQNNNNLFTGILPSNNLKTALNSLEKAFQLKTIITSKKEVILKKK